MIRQNFAEFRRVAVLVTLLSVLVASSASAQTSEASELAGIRRTLDQLLVMLRDFTEQASRRDTVAVLAQRLDAAERRLAATERNLQASQDANQRNDASIAELRGNMAAMTEMSRRDPTGSAAEPISRELARLQGELERRTADSATLTSQINTLTVTLNERHAQVTALEAALDRQLGLTK